MAENPMEDTEPHVQLLFHGSCRETGMESQDSTGVGFCVYTQRQHYSLGFFMGIYNFLLNGKIKNLERASYDLYLKTFKAIESDSVQVMMHQLNNSEISDMAEIAHDVLGVTEEMEKVEEKYVRLKEKFKHEGEILLNITTDWYDFTQLNYDLFVRKTNTEGLNYEIRTEELIKRFDKLLKEE
jgi:hypothetical protein